MSGDKEHCRWINESVTSPSSAVSVGLSIQYNTDPEKQEIRDTPVWLLTSHQWGLNQSPHQHFGIKFPRSKKGLFTQAQHTDSPHSCYLVLALINQDTRMQGVNRVWSSLLHPARLASSIPTGHTRSQLVLAGALLQTPAGPGGPAQPMGPGQAQGQLCIPIRHLQTNHEPWTHSCQFM